MISIERLVIDLEERIIPIVNLLAKLTVLSPVVDIRVSLTLCVPLRIYEINFGVEKQKPWFGKGRYLSSLFSDGVTMNPNNIIELHQLLGF